MAIKIQLFQKQGTNFIQMYPETSKEQVVGLMDGNKIKLSLLPDSILGGMRMSGQIAFQAGAVETDFQAFWNKLNMDTIYENEGVGIEGRYFIAPSNLEMPLYPFSTIIDGDTLPIDFDLTTISEDDFYFNTNNSVNYLRLEAGDFLVITKATLETEPTTKLILQIGVINNTYNEATTTSKGIVKLAKATQLNVPDDDIASDTGVITGQKLCSLMTALVSWYHPAQSGITSNPNTTDPLYNAFRVDGRGHITYATREKASILQEGFIKLSTDTEIKTAPLNTDNAMTPALTKLFVDHWGGIKVYDDIQSVQAANVAEGCVVAVLKS